MSTNNFRSAGIRTYNNLDDDTFSKGNNIASAKSSFTNSSAKPPASNNIPLPPQSKYKLLDLNESKLRDFVMSQLNLFDCRMEYDAEELNLDWRVKEPTEADITDYCKYVTISCKMENEIPIICLIYIERLLMNTGILLNKFNWQRIILCCLCLASKIWDDDSLENVHFPKVMPNVTNNEINKLEQAYLEFLDFKLVIKGSEYAKYYFIMRTLSENVVVDSGLALSEFENEKRNKKNKKDEWGQFPLKAMISADKMLQFQRNIARAELFLKEKHDRAFEDAFRNHKGKLD